MRGAIIEGGTVVNVINVTDADGLAQFGAVACGDEVGIGFDYDGSVFTAPAPAPDPIPTAEEMDEIKTDAKRRVARRADELGEVIAGIAPKFEELSWSDKRLGAIAAKAGQTPAEEPRIAILEAERSVTGESLTELADKILANVDLASGSNYWVATGTIAGQRRKTQAAIDALTDPATFKSDLRTVLDTAESEATALLAALLGP